MAALKRFFSNKVSILLVLLLFVVVGIVGIDSFFTDIDEAINTISIGENIIEIVEEFDPPEELIPGVSFTKDVKVKNTGSVECYVRIKAVLSDSHMEQYCEIDWNETDWSYNATDGYYYYPEALSSGAETPSLMTTVKIKDDAPADEIIGFDIIVYAESVEVHQGTGFDDYTQAWANYQRNKSN